MELSITEQVNVKNGSLFPLNSKFKLPFETEYRHHLNFPNVEKIYLFSIWVGIFGKTQVNTMRNGYLL